MKGVRLAALVAGALLLGACGGGGAESSGGGSSGQADEAAGGGQQATVVAKDFSFGTIRLEFQPGAEVTVTLDNQGEAEHTFTVEELDVEAEAQGGQTAEATFTMPDSGSLEFFCEYHPDEMTGTLSVIGAAGGGGESDDGSEKEDEDKDEGGAPGGGY